MNNAIPEFTPKSPWNKCDTNQTYYPTRQKRSDELIKARCLSDRSELVAEFMLVTDKPYTIPDQGYEQNNGECENNVLYAIHDPDLLYPIYPAASSPNIMPLEAL